MEEQLAMLEDIMELDEGTLTMDTVLAELEEWDSVSVLAFVALLDSEYHKTIKGSDVKGFVTVEDLVKVME